MASKDYRELGDQYQKMFGEEGSFPTIHMSIEEMADIFEKCIEAGKNAYEMGLVIDPTDETKI